MNRNESTGFMLSTTGRKLNQWLTSSFADYNVTSEQWSVLNRLIENDGVNQKELAALTEKDPTNVTRILDQLERKSLIVRKPHPTDRRSSLAFATAQGRQLNAQLAPLERQFIESILQGVSAEDKQTLITVLLQINDNLDQRRTPYEMQK